MTVETATYIDTLNSNLPGSTDSKSEGDNHIRLVKGAVKLTFPNITGAVTPTHTELNYVDGVTSPIQTQLNAATAYVPSGTGAVATTVQAKLRESVSVMDFGADPTGIVSVVTALVNALQSGAKRVEVPKGTYAIDTYVSATLPNDVVLCGDGAFVYTGASSTGNLFVIQCDGNSFSMRGLKMDGNNLIAGGPRIENQAAMDSDTLPSCYFEENTMIDFRMNSGSPYNDGALIRGSFERVVVKNNNVRNVTRAAGTGTPGSSGTSGISVTQFDSARWVRECIHTGNAYTNISGDDLLASPNNVDYDGFKFFSPSPLSFPNSDATVYNYGPSTLVSYGNSYRNCRGRAIKAQALAEVSKEKIIRDADYTIYGGVSEIDLQYGVGTVRDVEFFYNDYLVASTVTSPIQSAINLISYYQSAWCNESNGGVSVSGIRVYNGIKTGVGSNIFAILNASANSTSNTKDHPLIELSDVAVNRGAVDYIVITSFEAGSYGMLRLDAISVPKLTYSAIGTDFDNTGCEIMATGVVNLEGVKIPANSVKFVSDVSPAGSDRNWAGMVSGAMNRGFLHTFSKGADYNFAPMLSGAALSDGRGQLGGAASVQSTYLANETLHTFDRRFFTASRGLILVSVDFDYTTQGVLSCGGGGVYVIAAHGSNLFSASTTGSNLDTPGKLNLWFSGSSLNIKNRLGSGHSVTVVFVG